MRIRATAVVGRDDELSIVERALTAASEGRGGAVFIAGESGIGKSRLAAAAADRGFAADMRILRGRGSAIGPMAPFRSLTEALMSLLRVMPVPELDALGPYRPILARLIPDLGPRAAGEDGGSLTVLAEAVLRLVGLAGQQRGCLIVLDDLQDADAETLAVVEYLADNLGSQPAVLLGTVRSDPCPALGLARSAAQRGAGMLIELRRLGAPDVRRLAGLCLGADPGEVPERVAEHLWAGSGGIPLLVEELLGSLLDGGGLVRGTDGWRTAGELRAMVPTTFARSISDRLSLLDERARGLLCMAAVLGRRFPVTLLQAASGMSDRELLATLHAEPVSQLIAPDDDTPDWYTFAHPLMMEVLLTLLTPDERGRLAGRAAGAVAAVYPGLPGEWCQVAATLWLQAGDQARAGRLFTEAGWRAAERGAASSAVSLLDRALELLADDGDLQLRADAFAARIYALAEAGLVERALTSARELDQLGATLSRGSRAQLHTRIAWAAVVAGRTEDGLAQVEIARRLLGDSPADRDVAPVDVVAAHLALDLPGPDQVRVAERLARRAAQVAESADLPVVACQAWQLLGAVCRSRDPDEATACLERARLIAVRHGLPIEEIHALIRLGNDDALRDGSLARLEQARAEASRAGAVTARYQAEVSIALQAILRADFATAGTLLEGVLAATTRLRLVETTQYGILLRAVLAAHRGRRRDMNRALAELRRWKGDHAQHMPRVHGLARACCSLLEEDRSRAMEELSLALAAERETPTIFPLTGRYGLFPLLRALAAGGEGGEVTARAGPASRLRWDRQFSLLADAVRLGRAGRCGEAAQAVAQAQQAGEPYPMARHLGMRLVSEAALADGWGSPVDWLRAAEEYFHAHDVPAVASACRALMRRAGVPAAQHRRGRQELPAPLRLAGVTVREYEILRLLTGRLSNREIAARLHLSPRTVEKHVASLLTKTGQPDRLALGEFGATTLG